MEHNLLVLGASSDLALAVLKHIAGDFDAVLAHYHRSADKLEALRETAPNIRLLQADFTSEAETARLMEQVEEIGVPITHILHCPSAQVENRHFRKTDWGAYRQMLDTQLRSFYYAAHTLAPAMAKKQYGKIVTVITSYTLGTPPKFISPYVTAKYALLGCVKSLAAEFADKNVQINAVSPSMMETKFLGGLSHLVVEQEAADNPLGRNASVKDVTPMIEFLLSDKSGFITGQNVLISGGNPI